MSRYNPHAAALQRQQAASAREAAYRRATDVCKAVEARIASHGADGLAEFCAQYAGTDATTCTAILGVVLRRLGADVRDEVRDALP